MMLSELHNTYEYFEYQIIKIEGVTCFFYCELVGRKVYDECVLFRNGPGDRQ